MAEADLDVQIVVGIHDPRRSFERMVEAIVSSRGVNAGAIAVLHNLDSSQQEEVRRRLSACGELSERSRPTGPIPAQIEILTLNDSIPSPAGPLNLGLRRGAASWLGVAGSDDSLDKTALASWLGTGESTGADVVLAPIVGADGSIAPTPPIRPFGPLSRIRRPSPDRLFYRSSPVGVFRQSALGLTQAEMATGAKSGEDIAFMAALLAGARKAVVADPRGGVYRIHDDAPERASLGTKSVEDQLAGIRAALAPAIARLIGPRDCTALGVKLLRRDVVDAIVQQLKQDFDAATAKEFRDVVNQIECAYGDCGGYLSKGEWRAVLAAAAQEPDQRVLQERIGQIQKYRSPTNLIARDWWKSLSAQAPLRYQIASKLAGMRYFDRMKKAV